MSNIDVLIVGAGPVGLFCANELIRHGLTCRIIDKKSSISTHSKALGLHIRTLEVLEDCGLIKEVLEQGQRINSILVQSKGEILVNAFFKELHSNKDFLITLPQNQTEAILEQSLQNKGLSVDWGAELTHLSQSATEITATIKKHNNKIELFNANWLIACDGPHSTARHQIGASFKGSAYKQAWWLADLLIDWEVPNDKMALYISDQGPLACFPIANNRYRLVMTAPENNEEDPNLDDINHEFQKRSSDAAVLSKPIWLTRFSIHHRQIQQYRYDRVFFAGDAAHIHSPMGGQGLNTGIQDVYNLVWKLALVVKRKAKDALLNTYHEERYPVGHAVLKKTDWMTRMILLTNPLAINLRNTFIKFISSFPKIRLNLLKDLSELNLCYAKSSIVHQSGSLKHLKAGVLLPDFQLINNQTEQYDHGAHIVQGTKHHLFIFEGLQAKTSSDLMNFADSLATQYSQFIQIHLVLNHPSSVSHKKISIWRDEKQQVHQSFNIKKPALLLIRPDKYIGLLQQPINRKELFKYLSNM